MKKYIIEKEIPLGDFVKNTYKKWKILLKYGCVKVNGVIVTDYHHKIYPHDEVIIDNRKNKENCNLNIIFEDNEFIVVDKPSGLLTIATEKEKNKTLYHEVRKYLNKKNQKVFIIHRLDKDTSGIVMFAKNKKIKLKLQENWNEIVLKRSYIALVNGILDKKVDTIVQYLDESKELVKISDNGKLAITKYKVIKESNNRSVVDIELKTGRRNQIRVAFASLKHPIIGDLKYGNIKAKRLYLHAYSFSFIHPVTKKIYNFETEIPSIFKEV